jgi:hypothetical protein
MFQYTRRFLLGICIALSSMAGLITLVSAAESTPAVGLLRNNGLNAWVVPGDFNNDGITDLAAQSPYQGSPTGTVVSLGRGDATFGTPAMVCSFCRVLATGDFNNDHNLDLLMQAQPLPDEVVWVMPGRGDGTFGPGSQSNFAAFMSATTFGLAADMNNDGKLDAILGDVDADGLGAFVYVVPGKGDLSFDFQAGVALKPGPSPLDAVAADFNGDGRTDLAVASHGGHGITVFRNSGNLTFSSWDMGFTRQVNDLAAADINRDGKMDLVAATSSDANDDFNYMDGKAEVLFGFGNGTFQDPIAYDTARGAWQVVIGDFTFDGILDIATANRSSIYVESPCAPLLSTWDSVSILPGRTDGTFGPPSSFSLQNQADLGESRFVNSVLSLSAADVNRDRSPDLIASWGVVLVTQTSNPNWPPSVALEQIRGTTDFLELHAVASDVDHDMLTYTWTSSDGEALPPVPRVCATRHTEPGTHTYTVAVDDGHGHRVTKSLTFTSGTPQSVPITITAPAAGEIIPAGRPYTIRWTAPPEAENGGFAELIVHYSIDGGVTWTILGNCLYVRLSAHQCTWQSPGPVTDQAQIRMATDQDTENSNNPVPAAGASGIFTIRGGAAPMTGTPIALPGRIEAENYDLGGEGISYHDTTPGNSSGLYRHDDVDLQATSDGGASYKVKSAVAGEWLQYTVDVVRSGEYVLDARVSSSGTGGSFHLEVGGDVTSGLTVPNTGGWDTWRTVTSAPFYLLAGRYFVRLVLDTNGTAGLTGNFNWLTVRYIGSTPYTGTPIALPGKVQAENYDKGGEGIAYHDTTPGNNTGLYRSDDVDLQTTSDTGGGFKVKTAVAGEWLNYSVQVPAAGTYAIDVRVASSGAGGVFFIVVDGEQKASLTVPDTGGWESWQTLTVTGVSLKAGQQTWSLRLYSNGASGLTGNFNWIAVR